MKRLAVVYFAVTFGCAGAESTASDARVVRDAQPRDAGRRGDDATQVDVGAAIDAAGIDASGPLPTMLELFHPRAGLVLAGEQLVRWRSRCQDACSIHIRLSADSGSTFPTVIAGAATDFIAYRWDTRTLSDGETYRVRANIITATLLVEEPVESGDFAIDNTLPILSLRAPVDGQVVGRTATITWATADRHPGTVAIEVVDSSGASSLAAEVEDGGRYVWDTTGVNGDVQLRLTPVDAALNVGTSTVVALTVVP